MTALASRPDFHRGMTARVRNPETRQCKLCVEKCLAGSGFGHLQGTGGGSRGIRHVLEQKKGLGHTV